MGAQPRFRDILARNLDRPAGEVRRLWQANTEAERVRLHRDQRLGGSRLPLAYPDVDDLGVFAAASGPGVVPGWLGWAVAAGVVAGRVVRTLSGPQLVEIRDQALNQILIEAAAGRRGERVLVEARPKGSRGLMYASSRVVPESDLTASALV